MNIPGDFDLSIVESGLRKKSILRIHENENDCCYLTLICIYICLPLVSALLICCLPSINDEVLFVITPSACNMSIYEPPNNQVVEIQGNSTIFRNLTALYIEQHTTMEW